MNQRHFLPVQRNMYGVYFFSGTEQNLQETCSASPDGKPGSGIHHIQWDSFAETGARSSSGIVFFR
jgi:hypothetical protein